ncbi:S-layer family protein [Trichocoleus sp. FACHB-46]|uniref:Tandem-95 repeat protein n=2 Tax=Trichocoleus TaxID=450526 RepID=A0ABV0J4T1_9CYAN|nr:tandem-95 repeat protein [Trichocoleus sp. FACHB-46]MBD1863620.1 tandem-95 repeat protein [Trichocoleus sp. FACHB-46]
MPINNDAVTVNEDTVVSINVLGNDSSTDGSLLTIVNFSQATNGSVSSNGDGTFTYTPNANFNGSDSYTYMVGSGTGTESATVAITVSPINDEPIASNDAFTTSENTTITISALLANDFDVDGDFLTIIDFTNVANGVLIDNGDGSFSYSPNFGFTGADGFSYIISDGNGNTSQASVTISVGNGSGEGLGSINGTPNDDTLPGTNGNDTIYGYGGNDTISPGLGYDYVDGGEGEDTLIIDYSSLDSMSGYSYGYGSGYYSGYSYSGNGYSNISFSNIERFNITGTANNDYLYGAELNDILNGNDGDDEIYGGGGADILNGGNGNDTIYGGDGDDTINGGIGNDVIFSGNGADTIDGGAGDDALKDVDFSADTTGLNFNDTNPITGNITLANGTVATNVEFIDGLTTGIGNDTINFSRQRNNTINTGAGDDIINAGLGQDYVNGGEGEDTLTIDYSSLGYMYGSSYGNGNGYYSDTYNSISFSNIERFNITGTANNDSIFGGYGDDVLNGGAGDDLISGSGGADTIDGGAGDDALKDVDFSADTTGLNFNDTNPITGNITLANGTVATNVEFIDGLTTGIGNDNINYSRQRNNTINTGAGNDKINSGLGYDYVDGGEGEDTLVIDYSSLDSMSGSGNSYYYGYNSSYYSGYGVNGYSSINFSNIEHLNVTGTANSDIFGGGSGSDVLSGGAGNDVISSCGGADLIDGGAGEDGLGDADFSANTTGLSFSDATAIAGNITLANGTVATNVEFIDGLTTGSGNDTINFSRQRNNIINTGAGNDTINAGLGQDFVDGGEGEDTLIVDYSALNSMSGGSDYYSSRGGYFAGYGTDGFSSISLRNIEHLNVTGTANNDIFGGIGGDDVLNGGAGNDVISGGGGADKIDGGAGEDALNDADFSTATKNLTFGDTGSISKELKLANGTVITNIEFFDGLTTGSGNDTINYSRYRNNTINTGSGNDNINAGLGADTVDGGAGDDLLHIDYSSLSYMYGYNYSNGGGYYSGYSANGYNSISFSNIERLNITGTISSDSLYGGDGNDTLSGGFGNDYISGGAGNDTLNDGAGSDTLIGGTGNDAITLTNDGFSNTIFYTNGDGSDTVKQFRRGAGGDVIFFSGIAAIDVVKSGNGTQLRLSDGISNNAGFGKGALLVTLAETAGFAAADVNINLLSNDGGQFLFA